MLSGPLVISLIPGIIILLITWIFAKKRFPLFVIMLPGVLEIIASLILFYIGFVRIRGFEGGAYGLLAFFLFIFAIFSFIVGGYIRNSAR